MSGPDILDYYSKTDFMWPGNRACQLSPCAKCGNSVRCAWLRGPARSTCCADGRWIGARAGSFGTDSGGQLAEGHQTSGEPGDISARSGAALHRAGQACAECVPKTCYGKLSGECRNQNRFTRMDDAGRKIETWRVDYNAVRPRNCLGYEAPAGIRMEIVGRSRAVAPRCIFELCELPSAKLSKT